MIDSDRFVLSAVGRTAGCSGGVDPVVYDLILGEEVSRGSVPNQSHISGGNAYGEQMQINIIDQQLHRGERDSVSVLSHAFVNSGVFGLQVKHSQTSGRFQLNMDLIRCLVQSIA